MGVARTNAQSHLIPRIRFTKLLRQVTPSLKVHRSYLREAILWITDIEAVSELSAAHSRGLPFSFLEIMGSELFPGRQYLVAHARREWLAKTAPHCNAIAVPECRIGPYCSPPMVFVPERSKITSHSRAILEHEFVHVNQALLNRFPGSDDFRKDPVAALMKFMRTEFEANILELARYPEEFTEPKNRGLSLDEWCIFRGYSQALEHAVNAIGTGQVSRGKVDVFVRNIPVTLLDGFRKLGLDQKMAKRFGTNLPQHLAIAITAWADRGAAPTNISAWRSLTDWVSARIRVSPAPGDARISKA